MTTSYARNFSPASDFNFCNHSCLHSSLKFEVTRGFITIRFDFHKMSSFANVFLRNVKQNRSKSTTNGTLGCIYKDQLHQEMRKIIARDPWKSQKSAFFFSRIFAKTMIRDWFGNLWEIRTKISSFLR